MGHERIGVLPRTKPWKELITQIGSFSSSSESISQIARSTLKNVRKQYEYIDQDSGVQASYEFLVLLSHSFQKNDPAQFLVDHKIIVEGNITLLKIAKALKDYVKPNINSTEYGAIAQSAAIDALTDWFQSNLTNELRLFDESVPSTLYLKKLSNGSGFCEISRMYFANFTERYLKYFLEREASSHIYNIEERNRFSIEIENHIDKISRHAFETSKITQSFAAGWFNKNVKNNIPSRKKIEGFLNIAFGKMKGELLREEF
jgi:hypothetical protein